MPTILEINHVQFLHMINYPTLEIPAGQVTFISGESGSGKSTLLKLINNVLSTHSGEITYNGKNINTYNSIQLRKEILLCGQTVYLFDKTIRGNFNEYYAYRDLPPISDDQMNAHLHTCCLHFPLNTLCATLSGGEKHRVFIAICLSLMPKVLLLDEPTAALDEPTAHCLLQSLKAFCINQDITLVIVSHSSALAQAYADHTITLEMRRKT